MRRIISWEGEEKVQDVVIEIGALTWTEPIPVAWNFQHDIYPPFGQARELRREEDGSITAEIDLFDKTESQKQAISLVEHDDVVFTTYCNQLVEKREKNVRHIYAALIREVNIVVASGIGWR